MEALTDRPEFETALRENILRGAVSDEEGLSFMGVKNNMEATVSKLYHDEIDVRRKIVEEAKSVGDTDTVEAAEKNLETAKKTMRSCFAAGHIRVNKAIDGFELDTIVVELDTNDEGDIVPLVKSESGNTYKFTTDTTTGFTSCTCPDKEEDDRIPLCKHEIVWTLVQTQLYLNGITGILEQMGDGVSVIQEQVEEQDSPDIQIESNSDTSSSINEHNKLEQFNEYN